MSIGLALFDFDGTISERDSFLDFMLWSNRRRFIQTVIKEFPRVIFFKLRLYPNQQLKEVFLKEMFGGISVASFAEQAERFCNSNLPALIRPGFWGRCAWHREQGHVIAVVTATPRLILEPWCREHLIDIIGSELQTDQHDRITGQLSGLNCRGEEKVSRISRRFDLNAYGPVYAYGDTNADLPMLALAQPDNRYFKPFR